MFQFSLDLCDDWRTLVGQSSVELDQWCASADLIQGVLATGHTADSNNGYRTWNTNSPLSFVFFYVNLSCDRQQDAQSREAPLVRLYISLTASVARSLSGWPLSPPTSDLWRSWSVSGLDTVVLETIKPSTPSWEQSGDAQSCCLAFCNSKFTV